MVQGQVFFKRWLAFFLLIFFLCFIVFAFRNYFNSLENCVMHLKKKIFFLLIIISGLGMMHGQYPRPMLSPMQINKEEVWQMMKSLF